MHLFLEAMPWEEALFISATTLHLVSEFTYTYALKLTQAKGIWIEVRSQYHSLIYASAFP